MKPCLLLLACLSASVVRAADDEDGSAEHPYVTSSAALAKAYDDNRLAADQKYNGKFVVIVDRVAVVDKTIMGSPRVKISTSGEGGGSRAICTFVKNDEITKRLAALHKGDKISVVGKFGGMRMSVALLDKCSDFKTLESAGEKQQ